MSKARFETKNGKLFINDKEVLKGWESLSGWYWFAVEKDREQISILDGGKECNDTIWYGFVQGLAEEWGCFSQAEIESLGIEAWEIKKQDLPFAGRRDN